MIYGMCSNASLFRKAPFIPQWKNKGKEWHGPSPMYRITKFPNETDKPMKCGQIFDMEFYFISGWHTSLLLLHNVICLIDTIWPVLYLLEIKAWKHKYLWIKPCMTLWKPSVQDIFENLIVGFMLKLSYTSNRTSILYACVCLALIALKSRCGPALIISSYFPHQLQMCPHPFSTT